ncbi:heterokaryon incompatibility protein-domain-containing protein [Apiosordaria backusii]|uniref:Heterokaryon incompatibility protein-domain-containing protein n=1 Tax=Apiosordaria backusii TaxID=314023 RepID=A0AA40BLW1_9PEZI|nr:heterokaryon incompatibility protein-domain-containing protein [Apiosordaria backusii]
MSCAAEWASDVAGISSAGVLYEYAPLPESNAIRVLILKPGGVDDALCCSLDTTSLNKPIPYEAISYVWGSKRRDRPIRIDGRVGHITANLYRALHRMRLPDQRRVLWADSVCINQDDVSERGRQVLLMGEVYGQAKRVLLYLGEDSDQQGEAVRSLVHEIEGMVLEGIKAAGKSWNTFPTLNPEERERFLGDARWQAFINMTHQPWFTRGWVIQEAGLARDGLMLWGKTEISWRSFVRAYTWVVRRLPQVRVRYRAGSQGMNRLHLEMYRLGHKTETMPLYTKQSSHFDFLIVLHDARALCVQDARDRNYSEHKTAKDVYLDMAREYVNSMGNIGLLHCVQHTNDSVNDRFPSWVPRWDLNLFDNIITHTSGPALIPTKLRPSISQDNILEVKGLIFDEIIFTSDALSRDVSISDIKRIWNQIPDILPATFTNPLSTASSRAALAYAHVLSVGRSWGAEWPEWVKWRTAYIEYLCQEQSGSRDPAPPPPDNPPSDNGKNGIEGFHTYAQWNVHNRRIAVTKNGFFALVPLPTRSGDICCVLHGAKAPCILRKAMAAGMYRLVGDACIPVNVPRPHPGGEMLVSVGVENGGRDWPGRGAKEQDIRLC